MKQPEQAVIWEIKPLLCHCVTYRGSVRVHIYLTWGNLLDEVYRLQVFPDSGSLVSAVPPTGCRGVEHADRLDK